jgi:hypothetical protein
MTQLARSLLAVGVSLLFACSSSLPTPPVAQHPASAFVEVPYPPPAALAETRVKQPKQTEVVWIDGDWTFRGSAFAWQRGGWVVAPKGARYARSRVVYERDGRVRFAPATWYDASGEALDRIRPTTPAKTPPNDYTSEEQTAR